MCDISNLRMLAEKFMTKEGSGRVEELIASHRLKLAECYVAGAVHELWNTQRISDVEAAEACSLLSIPTEELAKYAKQNVQ